VLFACARVSSAVWFAGVPVEPSLWHHSELWTSYWTRYCVSLPNGLMRPSTSAEVSSTDWMPMMSGSGGLPCAMAEAGVTSAASASIEGSSRLRRRIRVHQRVRRVLGGT
jgi:hypothetical protein